MQIRTQVYCFVLFLAVLLTGSLLHSQAQGVKNAIDQLPAPRPQTSPTSLYSAVAQRFHATEPEVAAVAAKGLPPDQVAVAFFVAERSLQSPAEIAHDRLTGKSWHDIAVDAGLQPEQFYVPLPDAAHRPFVTVYALYHRVPRDHWSWNNLALTDADIQNMVNLQLLAGLDGQRLPEVMRMREQGLDFVVITNVLLNGQKTAERSVGGAREGSVRS